ncbi:MAG: hypothetical protein R3Y32_00255 [Bacillota bacterium]
MSKKERSGLDKIGAFIWMGLAVLLILIVFFPNIFKEKELDFLEEHEQYFMDFYWSKTEEANNYRYIVYDRYVETKVTETTKVLSYGDDLYLTYVAYRDDGKIIYWSAYKEDKMYTYTEIEQIPNDEWRTYSVYCWGSHSTEIAFILDSGANDDFYTYASSYNTVVESTLDFVETHNYIIYGDYQGYYMWKNEFYFEDGLAAKQIEYMDLNNDSYWGDDEITKIKIQDMYCEVDLTEVGA